MNSHTVKQVYELGYNDVLESLHLKEAGFFMNMAGKARDLGSRATGSSKGFVQARRGAINEGRAAVQGAKETSALGATKGKYEQKVQQIQSKATPPTAPPAPAAPAAATPPAEPPKEPGMLDKAKGWWGKQSTPVKAGIGTAVAAPVAYGLWNQGGDPSYPLPQQRQY
jgi:hypothetical protein